MQTIIDGGRTYRIVASPQGYVWNIGREHFKYEGYIPMYNSTKRGNSSEINTETLTAYNCGSEVLAEMIMQIVGRSKLVNATDVMQMVEDLQPIGEYDKGAKPYINIIITLKRHMYQTYEWKSGDIDTAYNDYEKKLRKYSAAHEYFKYCTWNEDDLLLAENMEHVIYATRAVFDKPSISTLRRWYGSELRQWKKCNRGLLKYGRLLPYPGYPKKLIP